MEKLRGWFGTPVQAGSTLIWLCWVSLLLSVFVTVLYPVVDGVLALVT